MVKFMYRHWFDSISGKTPEDKQFQYSELCQVSYVLIIQKLPGLKRSLLLQGILRQDIAIVDIEVGSPRITRAVQSFRVTDSQKIAFIGEWISSRNEFRYGHV